MTKVLNLALDSTVEKVVRVRVAVNPMKFNRILHVYPSSCLINDLLKIFQCFALNSQITRKTHQKPTPQATSSVPTASSQAISFSSFSMDFDTKRNVQSPKVELMKAPIAPSPAQETVEEANEEALLPMHHQKNELLRIICSHDSKFQKQNEFFINKFF